MHQDTQQNRSPNRQGTVLFKPGTPVLSGLSPPSHGTALFSTDGVLRNMDRQNLMVEPYDNDRYKNLRTREPQFQEKSGATSTWSRIFNRFVVQVLRGGRSRSTDDPGYDAWAKGVNFPDIHLVPRTADKRIDSEIWGSSCRDSNTAACL